MKHEHGEHNFQLCQQLIAEGKYLDWVITTAFYSSIHYFDHYFFPLNHEGERYEDIGEIHSVMGCPSKHVTRAELVSLYFNEQVSNYEFLDKACRNARYHNYQVPAKKAKQVVQRIETVRKRCLEEKPIPAKS